MFDKGLVSIYKELITQQQNDRHFSIGDVHMANKHEKRCSVILVIREMQIKTSVRYQFTSSRMTIIRRKRKRKTASIVRMQRNWNPHTLLMGM